MANPVKFDEPPVAEVVCGVMFSTLPSLKAAHFGLFWDQVRADFPRIEEAPPIDAMLESANGLTTMQVEFSSLPPLRRTWLLDNDGSHLIQLQQDRFLFNWKRVNTTGNYPSYEIVITKFEQRLAEFCAFLEKHGLGKLKYRQFELSYINIIGDQNGLNVVPKYAIFVDHNRDNSPTRFLPEPEAFNWATHYLLPNGMGRLHINAQTASLLTTQEKVVRLELSARGIPPNPDENSRRTWFNLGHEWITHGFADSTSKILHKTWRRTS